MPLYEYQCQQCGKRSEVLQRMNEPPLTECPVCGGTLKKLISSPSFQFKGSGWYVTDYAGKSKGGEGKGEGGEAKGEGKSESKGEGKAEGKGEGKAEGKSEGRSEGKSESRSEGRSEGKEKPAEPAKKKESSPASGD
jgi:putative FmdB family regulatory protein